MLRQSYGAEFAGPEYLGRSFDSTLAGGLADLGLVSVLCARLGNQGGDTRSMAQVSLEASVTLQWNLALPHLHGILMLSFPEEISSASNTENLFLEHVNGLWGVATCHFPPVSATLLDLAEILSQR